MVHPWVLAVSNNQEAVHPTSESQELNNALDMLCVLIVRIVQTRGVNDGALSPICDPGTRDLFGVFGAKMSYGRYCQGNIEKSLGTQFILPLIYSHRDEEKCAFSCLLSSV